MTALTMASQVGSALCEAIGVDPTYVHKIAFAWQGGDVARITIDYMLPLDKGEAVQRVFEAIAWEEVADG